MAEKFLKKPPPRYIYDMIMSTMAVTGFPKGLFTEDEMNPKFFDENTQNKIDIFQKTIEITKESTNKINIFFPLLHSFYYPLLFCYYSSWERVR